MADSSGVAERFDMKIQLRLNALAEQHGEDALWEVAERDAELHRLSCMALSARGFLPDPDGSGWWARADGARCRP
jgi:hypothetical protein